MGNDLGLVKVTRNQYLFNYLFFQLLGSYPIDMKIVKLLEETAADEGTLDKQLNIYDVCSTKSGRNIVC